jgi:hypothetical protein
VAHVSGLILERLLCRPPDAAPAGSIDEGALAKGLRFARADDLEVEPAGSFAIAVAGEFGAGPPDGLLRIDAIDLGLEPVHEHIARIAVLQIDDRRHGIDHGAEQSPAFLERPFRLDLLGDVPPGAAIAEEPALEIEQRPAMHPRPAQLAHGIAIGKDEVAERQALVEHLGVPLPIRLVGVFGYPLLETGLA